MIRIFPFIFIVLWSSAFITTKPIIDNSEPFSALAFRFFFVALGFYQFTVQSLHPSQPIKLQSTDNQPSQHPTNCTRTQAANMLACK